MNKTEVNSIFGLIFQVHWFSVSSHINLNEWAYIIGAIIILIIQSFDLFTTFYGIDLDKKDKDSNE